MMGNNPLSVLLLLHYGQYHSSSKRSAFGQRSYFVTHQAPALLCPRYVTSWSLPQGASILGQEGECLGQELGSWGERMHYGTGYSWRQPWGLGSGEDADSGRAF